MENGWLAGTQRERGAGSTSGPSGETKTPFPVSASRGWGGGAADLGAGDRGRSGPPAAVGGRAPWRGAGWFQDRAAVRGVLPGCRVEETPFPTTQQDSPGRASPSRGGDSLSGAVQNPRPPAPPPEAWPPDRRRDALSEARHPLRALGSRAPRSRPGSGRPSSATGGAVGQTPGILGSELEALPPAAWSRGLHRPCSALTGPGSGASRTDLGARLESCPSGRTPWGRGRNVNDHMVSGAAMLASR